jgi:hypothetical protein
VGETELGQHGPRCGQAEVVNEDLSQDPHGHGIEQQCALPGEADHAPVWVQFQEFFVMEILNAHRPPPRSVKLMEAYSISTELANGQKNPINLK